MKAVTHFTLIATEPRLRYRMKQMRFVPHIGVVPPVGPSTKGGNRDLFCEYMAQGMSAGKAAVRAGYTYGHGFVLARKIRTGA